jgi:hypothetical protein
MAHFYTIHHTRCRDRQDGHRMSRATHLTNQQLQQLQQSNSETDDEYLGCMVMD